MAKTYALEDFIAEYWRKKLKRNVKAQEAAQRKVDLLNALDEETREAIEDYAHMQWSKGYDEGTDDANEDESR